MIWYARANLIGTVDVYNVNVHGQFKGIAPELVGALQAPVIIQANGARKGADAQTLASAASAPGLAGHLAAPPIAQRGPRRRILRTISSRTLKASDAFKWIKISAARDGSFTVTNSRNGFSQKYRERK